MNQTLIALTPTEAERLLHIAMRQTERDDLPILEHLAFLLDRATRNNSPNATPDTQSTHRTELT